MTSQAQNAKMRYLAALESAKRAKETLISIRKTQERKRRFIKCNGRNRKRFMVGGLADMAGILEMDKETLLGAFMALARIFNDSAESATTAAWKVAGAGELTQHGATRLKK
jgi:hypothetical protein